MKKLLVLLVMCLFGTVAFAQTLHYNPNESPYANNMSISAVLVIDGEEIGADAVNLEVGFFDQNGACCAAKCGKLHKKSGRYKYSPNIMGASGVTYTCKVYDHTLNVERDLTFVPNTESPLVFVQDTTYGTTNEPYVLEFVTNSTTVETRDLTINGYGEDNPTGGYYLIASPFDGVNPEDVANMIDTNPTDYDLYSFDQAESLEWRNYKQGNFTTLVSGQGYLYARKATATLTFTGTVFNGPTKDVDIYYVEGAPHATSKGWNLVGNPFTDENAFIADGRNYYTLNETGSGINATSSNGAIAPMTAVFVESSVAGETITFTTTAPGKKGAELALNLSKDSKLVDRAIVRFDGNRNMRKFQLFENSTKLFIEQDNKDYAVVSAEAQGEVPVSFKAEKNGNYTLSFNTENVEFGYLHLIDNLTGNEVDLLASPSYSFEATTSDYASRFRLVFATSDAANSQFAFVGNGEIFLTGQGNVQVYDVTGRLIGSHNEVTHFSTNGMSAGVYMLQLSNGSDVKTQKIVVK